MSANQINIARTGQGIADIPRAVMNVALLDDCLNVCHMNVQSLCARQLSKFNEFKQCFVNSKVDIICLSETWLNENINDNMIAVDGYRVLRNDRKHSRGGGICIYHKQDLDCRVIAVSDSLTEVEDSNRTEYMFIEVRVNNTKFLLGAFYSPPRVECSGLLDQILSELSLSYSNVILLGDFNTDMSKTSGRASRFCSILENFGFNLVNNEPTHFYAGGSSLIDLLITNNTDFVLNFNQVAAPGFSQHDIIFSSLNVSRGNLDPPKSFRDYNRIDFLLLQNTLIDFDWSQLYSITDSDLALDFFNLHIVNFFENFVPLRSMRSNPNAMWFNDDILNAMIARNIAYRIWTSSRNESHHIQFKRLRNRVTHLINQAKSNFLSSGLNATNSSKELWKKLKHLNVASNSNSSVKIHNTNDEVNAFFGENFTIDPELPTIPPLNPEGFRFSPCNELEISSAILSISSNAVGMDGVPLKFIKLILPFVITPISYLFNLFISTTKFPRAWKMAKVIPIRKKPAGTSLNNLRPISILCSLSKAFEKILKSQIQEYVNRFNLLSPYQSGFRSGHSTTSSLLKVHDDIHKFVDKKGVAFLLLIDFSKAFDRVSHVKLLKKLSHQFGFCREAVSLINSYLTARTQVVDIEGNLSTPISILSGVPQGSVLGPLLFSLFINDLPSVLQVCMIHMFADDVQLYLCSIDASIEEMARLINNDLKNVSLWSKRNLLPINSSKTKAMFITRRQMRTELPNLTINNDTIEYVDKASNLGIIMQNDLEWDSQVNSQCGKIYAGLRHLRLTAGMLSVPTKIKLFSSLLKPHFSYGLELILNASAVALDRLRVALNHCVRWVFNLSRYARVTHLQRQLLGCSFHEFFKLRSCVTLFRIIHQGPTYLFEKLQPFRSTRVRHYVVPQHNSSHYGSTFFVRAINIWNQLPTNIQTIQSAARFYSECLDWLNGEN